jgi:hypothetical protein
MRIGSVCRFSSTLLAVAQSLPNKRFGKACDFIHTCVPKVNKTSSSPISDIIRHWTAVQPSKCALSTDQGGKHERKLTFSDIHTESARIANALMGEEFHLIPGKAVRRHIDSDHFIVCSVGAGHFVAYKHRTNLAAIGLSAKWFDFLFM